jgi:hypothetical protein
MGDDSLRKHAYITTYTGKRFSYDPPGPFNLLDIAHALSLTARFGGHTEKFYSVAQHSVLVARACRVESDIMAAAGLLHDAHEAYVGDFCTPMKWAFPELEEVESQVEDALHEHFGFADFAFWNIVRVFDLQALHCEARCLFWSPPEWVRPRQSNDYDVVPWTPRRAEREFRDLAARLGIG